MDRIIRERDSELSYAMFNCMEYFKRYKVVYDVAIEQFYAGLLFHFK